MAKKEQTTNSNYTATITDSSKELTAREKVMYKDTMNATSLLDMAKKARENDEKAIIPVITGYVVLDIHNESSEDVDYKNYIILDNEGNKYVTGSQSFWNSFKNIYDEMKEDKEPWGIQLNLLPSSHYKDKDILTCSLV